MSLGRKEFTLEGFLCARRSAGTIISLGVIAVSCILYAVSYAVEAGFPG